MSGTGHHPGAWWDEASIRWFKSASLHTGFHKKLSEVLRPHLRGVETLCDIACGLGLVDLELAGDLGSITCADPSEPALDSLRDEAKDRGIGNLDLRLTSWEGLSGHWDAVLLCHFGSQGGREFLPLCDRLISVVNVGMETLGPRPSPRKAGREARTDAAFAALGLPWSKETVTLEFGQPLLSPEDAAAFARHQSPEADRREIDAFLEEHLIRLDDPVFPWYLPHPKELAIYTVN